jgi:signal transduction histidine kinase
VGVALQLDTTATSAVGTPIADALQQACAEVDAALNEVRRLARGLRPADLDELGLAAAVEAAATRLRVGDGEDAWVPHVSAAVHLPMLAPNVEAAAYQMTLEAMTNAHRHSGGHHARVHIGVDPSGTTLIIEVVDDGKGFRNCDFDSAGVGLQSMRERAAEVGGSLDVRSPNGGDSCESRIPPWLRATDSRSPACTSGPLSQSPSPTWGRVGSACHRAVANVCDVRSAASHPPQPSKSSTLASSDKCKSERPSCSTVHCHRQWLGIPR